MHHPLQQKIGQQAQALAAQLAGKTAAMTLYKYVCPETEQDFYLPKKMASVKSPYTGKTFTSKPEKVSLGDVAKELKDDAKAAKPKTKKASEMGVNPADVAVEFLTLSQHPARVALATRFEAVTAALRVGCDAVAQTGSSSAVTYAQPAVEAIAALGAEAAVVAEQLTARMQ